MEQKQCYCSTYGCKGKLISKRSYFRHLKKDFEFKSKHQIEPVREKFFYWPKEEEEIVLHEGSDKTVVSEVARKISLFVDNNGYTKSLLAQNIKDHKDSLPSPNNFPASYLEARRIISPCLLPKKTYDACVNDCVLFRKYADTRDLRKASECDVCSEPRYKPSRVTISRKKVLYIGIEAQLLKRFGESNVAKLIYAGDVQLQGTDLLKDLHDGVNYQEWKETVFSDIYQAAVPFGLMTDVLNPNRNAHIQRSMWPIFLSLLSMKGKHCNILGIGLLLISVVPGLGDKEPKSLQMILDCLVDELLGLTEVKITPSYANAPTSFKCALLYSVCDFPAYAKVFHTAGQAACRACPYCEEFAPYEKQLSKCVHAGNRKYLDAAHPFRKQSKLFPCKAAVTEKAPPRINFQSEVEERKKYDQLTVASHKSRQLKATGFQGKYALQRLDYHDRLNQTSPDGRLLIAIADVIGNLMHFILGKSSFKEKQHEVNIGRLKKPIISKTPALHKKAGPTTTAYSKVHVKAPWELDKQSLKTADERLGTLQFPPESSLRPDPYFNKPCQLSKMEMKMRFVSENVMIYCVSGLLGKKQEMTLRLFSSMISELIQNEHDVNRLLDFRVKSQTILALIERDFPVSLQNITTHLLHHLIDSIEEFGPLQGRWLFPMERAMSWISRQTLNKHHQESTIIETYLLYEWIQWLRLVGKLEASPENSSPVFLSLLHEIGVHSTKSEKVGRVIKNCMLSNNKRCLLSKKLQVNMDEIDPQIYLVSKVSIDRNGNTLTYHTEASDAKKESLKAHYVCWSDGTSNFNTQHKEVQDIKDFNAGSVDSLVKAQIKGDTVYLARITQFEPVSYQIGGIWCCSLTSTRPPVLLPLTALSPPLIVDKRDSIIYFINPKVFLSHAELAAFNDCLLNTS